MLESMVDTEATYSDLIKEVYIDPIRTVIVIDDEFPTLDGMIAKELGDEQAWKGEAEQIRSVQEILKFCRSRKKPWLVDVHDGKQDQDAKIAGYLHHSDLVILDYHLDGDTNGGERSIKILRTLAKNDHFNMVVVYTKGYEGSEGDIDRVVREIALALSAPDESLTLSEETAQSVADAIEDWEETDEDILEKLKAEITEQTYLAVRSAGGDCQKSLGLPEGKAILNLYKLRPKAVQVNPKDLFQWLLGEQEKKIKDQLSPVSLGKITVSELGAPTNWIRTDRLFVSVVSKRQSAQKIPAKLLQALNQWCPRPHRLLIAKMRASIDEYGAVAEAQVLSNDFIQTGWLLDLLDTENQNKAGAISKTINRHWEALGDILAQDIYAFEEQLLGYLADQKREKILKKHSPLKLSDKTTKDINKHFNCYVSTKPVEGSHLTTGHVLEFVASGGENKYGVCLSPACDMVPGQKDTGWFGRLGNYLPFIIVFLMEEVSDTTALNKISENIFLFLNISDTVRTFSFNPNADIKANPSWEQMFAENSGVLLDANRKIGIGRLCSDSSRLQIKSSKARIVAQLRYEYALNLLQRLGVSLTRIGLDFKNISA